jgi:hypothetical protein
MMEDSLHLTSLVIYTIVVVLVFIFTAMVFLHVRLFAP